MNFAVAKGLPPIQPTTSDLILGFKYLMAVYTKAERRSVATTKKGYLCLAPPEVRVGDKVCILLGGHVSYILPRDGDAYRLIGECHVHRVMKGEAFKMGRLKESIRDIKLV